MAVKKYLFNLDLDQNELLNPVLEKINGLPSTASTVEGQFYYDTNDNKLKYRDNTDWRVPAVVLNDLEDVDLTGLTSGYVLEYNGTNWVGSNIPVTSVNGQTGSIVLDTDDISEGSINLYFTTQRSRESILAGTGIGYTSSNGVVYLDEPYTRSLFSGTSPIIYNPSTGNISITQASSTQSGYLSSTDWNTFNNKVDTVNGLTGQSITLDTDDINEGVANLYFTTQRARNSISIASGSQNYLSYATASGELSITALSITDVTTDNSATSSEAYFSSNYTGTEFQEGDTVILAGLTGGTEIYMHNGGTQGTSADFTSIDSPHLEDSYVRSLFSGTSPIVYNSSSGNISITQASSTTDGYLSSTDWNTFNNKVDTVNGLTGQSITLDTDDISEGVTNLYFTTQRARNSISSGTGIGYTSSNGIVYLDANLNELNDVVVPTPATNSYLKYDGNNWVSEPDKDLAKKTWHLQASSDANNTTDRYLESEGIYTNLNPLISHFDAEIISISIGSDGPETWTGIVYVNGLTATTISATASSKEFNNTISGVTFSAGAEISMYCDGTGVNQPRMQVMLREL